jgi:hypothetical protein
MKHIKQNILIFGLLLFTSCQVDAQDTIDTTTTSIKTDFEQIQQLIRDVYLWHEKGVVSGVDMIANEKNTAYIGFDLEQVTSNVEELKASNLFADQFLDNYAKIYRVLEGKLKNKEFEWEVGTMPPFGSGANPWCNCQDVPYDSPNPCGLIEIEAVQLQDNAGEFIWKWGES